MFRVGLLLACFVVVFAHGPHGDKCMRLMHPGAMECCKKNNKIIMDKDDDLKECFQLPPPCERVKCVASKKGIASSDGVIKKDALLEKLEKDFKDDPDTFQAMKEKCVDGDVSNYGPPDGCEVMKTMDCMRLQFLYNCSDLDDSGRCKGFKDLITECKEKFEAS